MKGDAIPLSHHSFVCFYPVLSYMQSGGLQDSKQAEMVTANIYKYVETLYEVLHSTYLARRGSTCLCISPVLTKDRRQNRCELSRHEQSCNGD
jgi:hypothetical protein